MWIYSKIKQELCVHKISQHNKNGCGPLHPITLYLHIGQSFEQLKSYEVGQTNKPADIVAHRDFRGFQKRIRKIRIITII